MTQPEEWNGLVSDEDWDYLSDRLSADRRRDLHGFLSECPAGLRAACVAEIRKASGFGDRAIALAIARLMHSAERSGRVEVSR
jgi:anti-sigma factor RsiW